jgi:hypothetical protein
MGRPSDALDTSDADGAALGLARRLVQAGNVMVGNLQAVEDGPAIRVLGAPADIRALSEHEAELRRMNRLHRTLSRVNQIITQASTRTELLDGVREAAVGFGKLKLAWVGWLDPATAQVIPVARRGEQSDYLDHIRVRPKPNAAQACFLSARGAIDVDP